MARDAVAHRLAHVRLHALAHDEDHALEPRPSRVEGRVVEEGGPAGTDAVELFGAAVAAADAGGEDDEAHAHGDGILA